MKNKLAADYSVLEPNISACCMLGNHNPIHSPWVPLLSRR